MHYRLCAALAAFVFPIVAAHPAGAVDDARLVTELRTLIESRRAQSEAIATVEMTYTVRMTRLLPTGNWETFLDTRCEAGVSGGRTYQIYSLSPSPLKGLHGVYDGTQVAVRTKGTNAIAVSRDPAKLKPLVCALPEAMIDPGITDTLLQTVEKRVAKIETSERVQFQNHSCAHFVISSDTWKFASRGEIWFDLERGLWPVSWKAYDRKGELIDEIGDVGLTRVESDGNVLYYPTTSVRSQWSNGKPTMRTVFSLDPSTLRVNRGIPATKFRLVPRAGEVYYDMDTPNVPPRRIAVDGEVPPVGAPRDRKLVAEANTRFPATAQRVPQWVYYCIGAAILGTVVAAYPRLRLALRGTRRSPQ